MTTILRFKGLTALPLFGSLPEQHLRFLAEVQKYINTENYIILDLNYTASVKEYFDASEDDSVLAIDINEKTIASEGFALANEIIAWMIYNPDRVELLSDQVADTAAGAKRRSILLTINDMKQRK